MGPLLTTTYIQWNARSTDNWASQLASARHRKNLLAQLAQMGTDDTDETDDTDDTDTRQADKTGGFCFVPRPSHALHETILKRTRRR